MVNWVFGDGFDLYTQLSDAYGSGTYWDSGSNTFLEISAAGRFSGSRGLVISSGGATSAGLTKSSGSNDSIHHIVFAVMTTAALTGTTNRPWLTLFDGTTAQCSIVVRSDGAILLTSGASSGTTLATYTGAMTASNTWYAFEIEIVINNTTGSIAVRKNGNNSNDFSATSLNTRGGTANNYANKLSIGCGTFANGWFLDDLLWRSDSSSVPWVGDIRCYTRMPLADSSVQFSRSGSVAPVTPFVQSTTGTISANGARYAPFTATCSGTVGTASISLNVGFTGNLKCTIFNDTGSGAPGTVLGSATTLSNPVAGSNTITFGSPPSVVRGTQYWVGFISDTTTASAWNLASSSTIGAYPNQGATSTSPTYASFPTSTPTLGSSSTSAPIFTVTITPTTLANADMVSEIVQDAAATYIYDSTVNDADFYTPGAIAVTPNSTVAVITRALALKTDAGTRNIALQIQSGATLSTGTSAALNTTWGWLWKVDQVDPATSAAWTATAVNNLIFGPKVSA
jgi:hypothetical protein